MELPSTAEDQKFIYEQIQKVVDAEDRKSAESTFINQIKSDLKKDYGIDTKDTSLLIKLLRKKTTADEEKERIESVSEVAERFLKGEIVEDEEE